MTRKQIIRRTLPSSNIIFPELHPLLQRIYSTRQVHSLSELDQGLETLLPFSSLLNIERAAQLIAEAVMFNQSILIVGDFDADGATSTAVAIRALRSFGAQQASFLVPNRFAFGYGLTPELVTVALENKPSMIITVDNGIANHAGVSAAKSQGISVVITDHHLSAATLPEADAIVNPNQPGDCFPSKHLAGVGVIFYVMLAVRRYLMDLDWFEKKNLPVPNMARLLDLVALGTVADVVPLDHNNRILVHQGLRRIQSGQCIPAIIALLELANRDFQRVVASDLGFAVGARLNAAGRLDDMSLGIENLLCDDPAEARVMARTLDQLNDERRHIEQDMQAQALTIVNALQERLDKQTSPITAAQFPKGLCLYDATWHQGVIGILASRLKDRFHRPVIIFAPGMAGELKGSARSIPNLHIRDVLARLDAQHPQLIKKFGGHAMAAGLTIAEADFAHFSTLFDELVAMQLTEADLAHTLFSDGELLQDQFNLEIATLLRNAGPWGQAFPEPLFDNVFKIKEQRIVGGKHLKLVLAKEDVLLNAIAFFVDTQQWPNHRCESVHAAYRLDVNEYKGKQQVQLIVEHLEPH